MMSILYFPLLLPLILILDKGQTQYNEGFVVFFLLPEHFIILGSTIRFLDHFVLFLEVVLGKVSEQFLDTWTSSFLRTIY